MKKTNSSAQYNVFVIMPFTDIPKAVYEDGIKKAFEEQNTKWQVIRADEDSLL